MKIKKWYTNEFYDDELGNEINGKVSFESCWKRMNEGEDFYDIVSVRDSVVRHRIFEKIAEVFGINVEVVYYCWCGDY